MVTIFANIRINNEESIQHLKDSFFSFNTISDNWLVNIRGEFRNEAISFLKENLSESMVLFELLDDSNGWINNSIKMISRAKYDYVLIWNEDHMNIVPQEELLIIIKEMEDNDVDYMLYSWWMFGRSREILNTLPIKNGKYIDMLYLTKKHWNQARNAGHPYYLLSLCGIYKKDFFEKLLYKDRIKLPMYFTNNLYRAMTLLNYLGLNFSQRKCFNILNKIFFYKFRRFSKETPFDLEKGPDRVDVLPLKMALAKHEIFACIDDDLDIDGYQLIKRGGYPMHFFSYCDNIKINEKYSILESNKDYKVMSVLLKKGDFYKRSYYQNNVRTNHLLKETIIVLRGKLSLKVKDQKCTLESGGMVVVYPNLGYFIEALDSVHFLIVSAGFNDKNIRYLN